MNRGHPTRLEPGGENALAVALGLLGDEWNLQIVRYALNGMTRYGEWRDVLPVSHSVLSDRLARLTGMGLFERVQYERRPPRHAYRLTGRGRATWPILVAIWSWEAGWVEEHAEAVPRLVHLTCGRTAWPVLICQLCGDRVGPRDLETRFGPSGSWERSVPRSATRRRAATVPTMYPETMAMFGNRWSATLLGAAFLGSRRFTEFQERMSAPPSVVADRLRTLCAMHVLERSSSAERSDRATYRLTHKGRAFLPVVLVMMAWAQRWFRAPEGPALQFWHHAGSRHRFSPRLACPDCGACLRGSEIGRTLVARPPASVSV